MAGMGSGERIASFTGTSRSVSKHGWILPSAVSLKRLHLAQKGSETGVMTPKVPAHPRT